MKLLNAVHAVLHKTRLSLLLFLLSLAAHGGDTDSLTNAAKKRANRSALYSAVLPGLGQAYNQKYWKIPIIYAGTGTLLYFIDSNNKNYKNFKRAYLYRTDTDPATTDEYPNYTKDDLQVRKDYYRRNRDLSYILLGVLYTLNIIDAYVDSQLRDFDVSDNLSLRTDPLLECSESGQLEAGIKLTFAFK